MKKEPTKLPKKKQAHPYIQTEIQFLGFKGHNKD